MLIVHLVEDHSAMDADDHQPAYQAAQTARINGKETNSASESAFEALRDFPGITIQKYNNNDWTPDHPLVQALAAAIIKKL